MIITTLTKRGLKETFTQVLALMDIGLFITRNAEVIVKSISYDHCTDSTTLIIGMLLLKLEVRKLQVLLILLLLRVLLLVLLPTRRKVLSDTA